MAHIHTEPGQHDATSSAWIIRLDTPSPTLFLHKHKKLNAWLQPGGHVELLENPWQSVLHELAEETGYVPEQMSLRQPKLRLTSLTGAVLHPVAFSEATHDFTGLNHKHTDRTYLFTTFEAPRNAPAEGESQDIRWVTAEELASDPEMVANVRELGLFAFQLATSQEWADVPVTDFQA